MRLERWRSAIRTTVTLICQVNIYTDGDGDRGCDIIFENGKFSRIIPDIDTLIGGLEFRKRLKLYSLIEKFITEQEAAELARLKGEE